MKWASSRAFGAAALAMMVPVVSVSGQTRVGGFVEADNLIYVGTAEAARINARRQLALQAEVGHTLGERYKLVGVVEFRYDHADPDRNRAYVRETYLDARFRRVDVRVGRQTVVWGRADGFNPTDNLSAWDYADPIDFAGERLPVHALRAQFYQGDWSVETVVSLGFRGSLLPSESSRWWSSEPPVIILPSQLHGRRHGVQYAVRVERQLAGADVSVSWFDGLDDLPTFHPIGVDPDTGRLSVEPRFHARRAVGADLSRAVGRSVARVEAAYFLTADPRGVDALIDDPYLHYVAGLDRTFRVGAELEVFASLEWSREHPLPDRAPEYRIHDLNHLLRESLLGRIELRLGPYRTVAIEGIGNRHDGGWLLRPQVSLRPRDSLLLHAGIDVLGGPTSSFFGYHGRNDRGQVKVVFAF